MAAQDKAFPYEFSEKNIQTLKEDYVYSGYDVLVYVPALRDSSGR